VVLRDNLKQKLMEKVIANRVQIALKQSTKLGRRKEKLTKKL